MIPHPHLVHPILAQHLVYAGGMGLVFVVASLLFLGLVIVVLVDLTRARRQHLAASTPPAGSISPPPAPLDPAEVILRERLAKGEIDAVQFEATRAALGLK